MFLTVANINVRNAGKLILMLLTLSNINAPRQGEGCIFCFLFVFTNWQRPRLSIQRKHRYHVTPAVFYYWLTKLVRSRSEFLHRDKQNNHFDWFDDWFTIIVIFYRKMYFYSASVSVEKKQKSTSIRSLTEEKNELSMAPCSSSGVIAVSRNPKTPNWFYFKAENFTAAAKLRALACTPIWSGCWSLTARRECK